MKNMALLAVLTIGLFSITQISCTALPSNNVILPKDFFTIPIDDPANPSTPPLDERRYYISNIFTYTWDDANTLCNNIGMKLVSIDQEYEQESIMKFILDEGSLEPIRGIPIWTSGTGIGTDKTSFKWDSTGAQIVTDFFTETYPNFPVGTSCLYFLPNEVDTNGEPMNWRDTTCTASFNIMCEQYP